MIPVTDADPVADDEFLLRRVHRAFFNPALGMPVQPEAFRPTDGDTDGLSVHRERFVTAADSLAAVAEDKRAMYCVVRLSVGALRAMGLTIDPSPDSVRGIPGHALIRELNCLACRTAVGKPRCKAWQRELAKLAGTDIVLPFPNTSE